MMLVPRKRGYDLLSDAFADSFFNDFDEKVMKTDIKEHKNYYEVLVDLPGFAKEDIKMNVEDGYLTINASTSNKNEEKDDEGKYVRQERYYGKCSRSFYVGNNVTNEDIKAKFKNGTLNINIPKKEEQKKIAKENYIQIEG